jgi:hypothetical protein
MTKQKITISLSPRSLAIMEALRELTDADTDSEVFRNALRLHLACVRAHQAGIELFVKKGDAEPIPVPLFVFVEQVEKSLKQPSVTQAEIE